MDVTLPKKDLSKLVARIQGVADKKGTLPILSNALIQATPEGVLRASGTDLHLAISTWIAAQVNRPGSIAIPAKDMLERLKVMPEGGIQMVANEGGTVLLKAVGSKREFRLRGMNVSDYPALPTVDTTAREYTLPSSTLADLIQKTSFSISTDETRPHLNSALLEWKGTSLRMVSTDGHRLSLADCTVAAAPKELSVLLPLKGIQEVRRMCDELKSDKLDPEASMLRLAVGGANVFFIREDTTLAIKMVDATFPPYQQVIPKMSTHAVRIPKVAFIDTLRAMSVAASDRTGSVKVSLASSLMKVTSENPDTGEAIDELAVDYSGPEMSIGFNVKYLLDAISGIDDEEVRLGLSGELDPVMIEPWSRKGFLGIVMPMRI